MAEVYDNDTSASNNNSPPPAGWPENMQYDKVNDTGREQMAVLGRYIEALGALTTTGLSNAYILTVTQAITVLTNGMHFIFKADKTNTGAVTFQLNALGAVAVTDNRGDALVAGDIQANSLNYIQFEGAQFRLVAQESAATVRAKIGSATDSNVYNDAAVTKLAGIETGATADQTSAQIKTAYEANLDTNAYNDAAVTKLAGIETGATADQTSAQIKTAYEANLDTNAYNDAAVTKLNGLEALATVDDTRVYFAVATAVKSVGPSTTLVDDTDLELSSLPVGRYAFEMCLVWEHGVPATTSQGIRFTFNMTTGVGTGNFSMSANNIGAGMDFGALYEDNALGGEVSYNYGANTDVKVVQIMGHLNVTSTGDFTFQLAQESANSTTRRLAGSWLRLFKLT